MQINAKFFCLQKQMTSVVFPKFFLIQFQSEFWLEKLVMHQIIANSFLV